ncbi:MAG: glycoside hydrolase family 3 protein [Treponema sp.]|nr:glycoside hydrolase family 3 protein [Treponema sp.]
MRLLCILLLLFSGCLGRNGAAEAKPEEKPDLSAENPFIGNPAPVYDALRDRATRLADGLNDRQLAAQVIISGIDGKGHLTADMRMLLAECPAGGIMLFKYNLDAENAAIRELVAEAAALAGAETAIPPFVAVDHEGGAVNRFRRGVASLPSAGSYGEMAQNRGWDSVIAHITSDSFIAGREINDLGVTMNLAPVAEFLNVENRDFLDERSYGPDPAFVAAAAAAFIEGMGQAGVLCVVKHFPGSAGADPHLYPSVLKGDKAALAEQTAPVVALIRGNQARAIMVSHSAVPALDSRNIASLSPAVMDVWLRQELGFDGLIICDDFSMASAGSPASAVGGLKPEMAAVRSLAVGADMVLVWPPDLRRTHRAILAALDDRRLSRERLREAAGRIIYEKMRMGLIDGDGNGE